MTRQNCRPPLQGAATIWIETETKRSEYEVVTTKTLQDFHANVKVWLASVQSASKHTRAPALGLLKISFFDAIDVGIKMSISTMDEKSERYNQIKIRSFLLYFSLFERMDQSKGFESCLGLAMN
jgi:hypothetical protein